MLVDSKSCGPTEVYSKPPVFLKVGMYCSVSHRYLLNESCRSAERMTFPLPHASSTGPGCLLLSPKNVDIDIWRLEAEYPPSKRSRISRGSKMNEHGLVRSFAEHPEEPLQTVEERPHDARAQPSVRDTSSSVVTDVLRCSPNVSGHQHPSFSSSRSEFLPMSDRGRFTFRVMSASRRQIPSVLGSDVIGTIDFDESGEFFATGGIARKIRISSYSKLAEEDVNNASDQNNGEGSDDEACSDSEFVDYRRRRSADGQRGYTRLKTSESSDISVTEICTPAKLSSLKWRPGASDVIGCGDYDGVVAEWDVEYGHTVSERFEHCGQRVWSLDYSKVDHGISASAAGDRTTRIWSRGVERSVAVIKPLSNYSICCAALSPASPHLVALASADANAYVYDLRNTESPLLVLLGHRRSVSYVQFLSHDRLVSASIDSTVKIWDIASASASPGSGASVPPGSPCVRTYGAHTNRRNFTGLSVHEGAGLVACGSETNEVFVYERFTDEPLVQVGFPHGKVAHNKDTSPLRKRAFVGAVCWREQEDNYSLVAANSDGNVQLIQSNYSQI